MKYQKTDDPKVVKIMSEKKARQSGKTPIGFLPTIASIRQEEKMVKIRENLSQKGLHNIEKPKPKSKSLEAQNQEKAVQKIIQIWNSQPKIKKVYPPKTGEKPTKIYTRTVKSIQMALNGELVFPTYKIGSDKKYQIGHFKTSIEKFASTLGNAEYDASYLEWAKKVTLADFIKNSRPYIDEKRKPDLLWNKRQLSPFLFFVEHELETKVQTTHGFGDEALHKEVWDNLVDELLDKDEFPFEVIKDEISDLCYAMEKRFKVVRPYIIKKAKKPITLMKKYIGWIEEKSDRKETIEQFFWKKNKDGFMNYLASQGYFEDKLFGDVVDGKRWYEMTKGEQKNALIEREEKRRKDEEERKRIAEQKKKDAIEYARIERNRRIKERLNSKYKASKPQKHRDPVERKKADELVKLYSTKYKPKLKQLGIAEEAALHLRRTISKLTNSFDSYTLHIKWCDERFAKEE